MLLAFFPAVAYSCSDWCGLETLATLNSVVSSCIQRLVNCSKGLVMRWLLFHFSRYVLVVFVGLIGAFGAPSDAASAGKMQEGIRFTIDGPVFGGPTSFVVPSGKENLQLYMSESMFSLMLKHKRAVRSEDGKHMLDMMVLGTEPAGVGEFTESTNLSEFTLGFTANEGTPKSESVSMSFSSKGVKQPVRLVISQYDRKNKITGGHFSARLRRSNIKSTDQFYEAKGEFLVKK
jgi:hypothetical protein